MDSVKQIFYIQYRFPFKLRRSFNFLIFLLLHKEFLKSYALMPDCPLFQMHFQKIIGIRPESEYINERNRLLPDDMNSTSTTISYDCYKICKKDPNCIAYVHIIDRNECYGYSLLQRTPHYFGVDRGSFHLIGDPNAIFYEKVCLKVPENCNDRLWVLTKIPGNSLVLQGKKTIQSLITRRECAERCLFERDFKCLSASFQPSVRNNQERIDEQHPQQHRTIGLCILSDKDKMIQPDAFRTAPFDEEYIENQCHTRPMESDHCSYELYGDSTFHEACTEAQFIGVTQKKCQSLCTKTSAFHCQGASYFYDGDMAKSICSLHSEDIVSMGPRSLKSKMNSVYMRRVKCLDVKVVCTKDEMTIKYTPNDSFRGKIYTSWHSKDCSAKGYGNESIALHLAIGNESQEKRCGVLRAYEVTENHQRTFITTFVIIQNNANVQTQGDRLIKVGCILKGLPTFVKEEKVDDAEKKEVMPSAIALESSSSSLKPTKLSNSNFTGSSGPFPKITFQIIDLSHNYETKDVQVGQNLELQITAEYSGEGKLQPPNFRATSLIAKTEGSNDKIVLIDERGCPTDVTVFPAFERITTNTESILRARFHAFKFVGTSAVNFDVKIHFCGNNCSTDNCIPYENILSRTSRSKQHRKRRQVEQDEILRPNNQPLYISAILDTIEPQKPFINDTINLQLPLTYNLQVHGYDERNISTNFDGANDAFVIIATEEKNLGSFCFDQSLLIAIFIFILILITLIIFVCCFVIQKRTIKRRT